MDESSRQREEINILLAQVCDLQKRVQTYSHENDDLTANLRVYQETQDELTVELVDLKEKYREVVERLREANDEIRRGRKRGYPGLGSHSVQSMFPQPHSKPGESVLADHRNVRQTAPRLASPPRAPLQAAGGWRAGPAGGRLIIRPRWVSQASHNIQH